MRDKQLIERAFEQLGDDATSDAVDEWVRDYKRELARKTRFSWTALSPRKLLRYNLLAAAPTVLGALGATLLAVHLGSRGEISDEAFFAMFVGLPTLLMGAYGLGRRVALEKHNLLIGNDGFVLNGRFSAWSDIDSIDAQEDALKLAKADGNVIALVGAPAELSFTMTDRLQRYREFPLAPELPEPTSGNTMGYRDSHRVLLVRVASNPRAASANRRAASQALSSMGGEDAHVVESLEDSVNPELRPLASRSLDS